MSYYESASHLHAKYGNDTWNFYSVIGVSAGDTIGGAKVPRLLNGGSHTFMAFTGNGPANDGHGVHFNYSSTNYIVPKGWWSRVYVSQSLKTYSYVSSTDGYGNPTGYGTGYYVEVTMQMIPAPPKTVTLTAVLTGEYYDSGGAYGSGSGWKNRSFDDLTFTFKNENTNTIVLYTPKTTSSLRSISVKIKETGSAGWSWYGEAN